MDGSRMEYDQSYILHKLSIKLRVLMPRGQTIVHLPQSIQEESIGRTSSPR